MNSPLVRIENLAMSIQQGDWTNYVLNGLNLEIPPRSTVGLVGESGCGKSITALALLGLLPRTATITQGSIYFREQLISDYSEEQYRQNIRGKKVAMIFQDALVALNPVFTVGNQIGESIRLRHPEFSKREVQDKILDLLEAVRMPNGIQRIKEYPHQLSGGMRQRVLIAMALAAEPELLIADEPTTALDVTIQAQILALMQELQGNLQSSILLITHDMGVIAQMCDQVHVMYGGQIVERGPAHELFRHPRHPYTIGLLNSIPQGKTKHHPLTSIPGNVQPWLKFPQGCVFADRCWLTTAECQQSRPPYITHGNQLQSACFKTSQTLDLPRKLSETQGVSP